MEDEKDKIIVCNRQINKKPFFNFNKYQDIWVWNRLEKIPNFNNPSTSEARRATSGYSKIWQMAR